MSETPVQPVKKMNLRYRGTCRECGITLEAREPAYYDPNSHTVFCIECPPKPRRALAPEPELAVATSTAAPSHQPTPVDLAPQPLGFVAGIPGKGAQEMYERRESGYERTLAKHGDPIKEAVLQAYGTPQSINAWAIGAVGERTLGAKLNELAAPHLRLLHDRKIPGRRENIDHLAVTPQGIYVIDAKKYTGQVKHEVTLHLFAENEHHLVIRGRNHNKLCDGVLKQTSVVAAAVSEFGAIPIQPVLCIQAEWGIFEPPFMVKGVLITWGKELRKRVQQPGNLQEDQIAAIHQRLAEVFRAA